MRNKKIISMCAAVLLSLSASAAETTLVVELVNGQQAYYKLQEKPVLTMSGTKVRIESNMVEVGYERSNVKKFYFTNEDTAIKDVKMDDVVFTQTSDDEMVISNVGKEYVVVCDVAGHIISDCVSKNGDSVTISLGNSKKGVYIIKVGNKQTIKITKK